MASSSEYLIDCEFGISYGPLDDRLNGLYLPALSRSAKYDRTAGFFSPQSLAIAARGVEALIRNRGQMRLLVGAGLVERDLANVRGVREIEEILKDKFLSLLEVVEPWMKQGLEVLGWMAADRTLEIRIVLPHEDGRLQGVATAMNFDQPRIGIFTDPEGNQLGIYGAVDESLQAGDQNYEQLVVYKSWEPSVLYLHVIRHHFERLWEGKEPGWRSLMLPEAVIDRLIQFCPGKLPVRNRGEDAFTGKSELSSDVRKMIILQFLRDAPYFPFNDTDQPGEKSKHAEEGVLQETAILDNPESCSLPLMRFEAGPKEPLVVYYHLQANQISPLRSIEELEAVFHERTREYAMLAAAEIRAREHFHGFLKAREDLKVKDRQKAEQQKRSALMKAGERVLIKAALCDIAKSRHATLFDEDLLTAGFDEATILRQKKKGFPYPELIALVNPDERAQPALDDPFWRDVDGKTQKKIQAIEAALIEEGRDLIKKWTALGSKLLAEAALPGFAVRKYYMTEPKEKPRLTLVIAPPHKERFTRYLPFYSMESAFDKFGQGRNAGEDGWMEVEIGKKLNKSMFVMRTEGRAMEPLISDGHFVVFDSDIKGSLDGAILFVYGKDIYDPNRSGHLTVRRFRSINADAKTGKYQEIILEPLHPDYQRLHFKNIEKSAFKIIARYVSGV
ncbi:MAG: hypothetical protein NTZ57_02890 [Deltaproteobacteria bacterium]|nr:hypothetical protein [Deltaproteobacteria bacterium]